MSSVIIQGDSSGSVTLQAPAAAGSTVINLPSTSMNIGQGGGNVSTNTAFGASALASNTTGASNTVVGYQAAFNNTTANSNTVVGYQTAYRTTTGADLTAIGQFALFENTTGGQNTALGRSALQNNTTAYANSAVGYQALYSNTTGADNTAMGYGALQQNTTASNNSAFGEYALKENTTGQYNSAFGRDALRLNTTASNNTAVGYQAAYSNSTGAQVTAVGYQAGYTSTGNYNTLFGYKAGYLLSSGILNTFVGPVSGQAMTTGTRNTIIGAYDGNQGGLDIRTASNYIVLSDGDGNPRIYNNGTDTWFGTTTNATHRVIDPSGLGAYLVTGHPSGAGTGYSYHIFQYAGGTIGQIYQNGTTAVGYSTSSDYRLKENVQPMTGALDTIAALNPVTYNWKTDGSAGQGFIAHELQHIFPDAVHGEKDAVDENGDPIYQGIDTSFLVATLTAAIQELNAKVEAQAAEIATLKGQA